MEVSFEQLWQRDTADYGWFLNYEGIHARIMPRRNAKRHQDEYIATVRGEGIPMGLTSTGYTGWHAEEEAKTWCEGWVLFCFEITRLRKENEQLKANLIAVNAVESRHKPLSFNSSGI